MNKHAETCLKTLPSIKQDSLITVQLSRKTSIKQGNHVTFFMVTKNEQEPPHEQKIETSQSTACRGRILEFFLWVL